MEGSIDRSIDQRTHPSVCVHGYTRTGVGLEELGEVVGLALDVPQIRLVARKGLVRPGARRVLLAKQLGKHDVNLVKGWMFMCGSIDRLDGVQCVWAGAMT